MKNRKNTHARKVIKEVESGERPLSNDNEKGNYAEMKMDIFFEEEGYKRISINRVTDLEDPTHYGIDGVYYNPNLDKDKHKKGKYKSIPYIISEAKFNSSKLSNTRDGKQMSDLWINGSNRLEEAVGKINADKILIKGYEKKVVTFTHDGKMKIRDLSTDDNIDDEEMGDLSADGNTDNEEIRDSHVRDYIKAVQYFDVFIAEDQNRVTNFSDKLKNGKIDENRIHLVKSKIFELKLGLIIAGYSRGDDPESLKEKYIDLIEDWEDFWSPKYYKEIVAYKNLYYKVLKLISLGILLEADRTIAGKIKNVLDKVEINDWLLSFMLSGWNGEIKTDGSGELLFRESFSILQQVVVEENKIELLSKYLREEWYNKVCDCHESHISERYIYYGYWSFEAGAIAKILKLDDAFLKGMYYYPYELVHYR